MPVPPWECSRRSLLNAELPLQTNPSRICSSSSGQAEPPFPHLTEALDELLSICGSQLLGFLP